MSKENISTIVVVVVVLGAVLFFLSRSNTPSPTPVPADDSSSTIPTPVSGGIKKSPSNKPPVGTPPVSTTTPTTPEHQSVSVTHNLTIENFRFSEATTTIKKGDKVVWVNKDAAPHTVTGYSGGPDSGTLDTGDTYSYTFTTPGTYAYHCKFHPQMSATITVLEQ